MSQLLLSNHNSISDKDLLVISNSIKNILADQTLDASLKALAVQLPNLNSLIGEVESIELDDLFALFSGSKVEGREAAPLTIACASALWISRTAIELIAGVGAISG